MEGFFTTAGGGEVIIECSAASLVVATSGGAGGRKPMSVANTRPVVVSGESEGMWRSSHQLRRHGQERGRTWVEWGDMG